MAATAKPKTRKRYRTITEVDADTWAESGGTGGMFGAKWARGLIRIVDRGPSGGREAEQEAAEALKPFAHIKDPDDEDA